MNRTRMMGYTAGLALVLIAMLWIGCSSSKSKEEESVAALPELEAGDVATLKAVPNSKALATSVLKRGPQPEAPKIQPPCPADDVTLTYSAEVDYPVTVCTLLGVPDTGVGSGVFTLGIAPTHKLDNSKLPKELQSQASRSSSSAAFVPIWRCKKDKGPWQGVLTSEKGCTNTCATDNILTLLNTPNLIGFEWYGSIITDKPPDFQFVGQLQLIDTVRDKCHKQNVATPKK